jgi:hypothetical protein
MYISPLVLADLYSLLNEEDEAFKWLDKLTRSARKLTDLKLDPDYDNIRTDPRFDAPVKRIGLP